MTALEDHPSRVTNIPFSPDSKTLTLGSDDNIIREWDVAIRQVVRKVWGHSDWVTSVAFRPDSNKSHSFYLDKSVRWVSWNRSRVLYLPFEFGSSDVRTRAITRSPTSRKPWESSCAGVIECAVVSGFCLYPVRRQDVVDIALACRQCIGALIKV